MTATSVLEADDRPDGSPSNARFSALGLLIALVAAAVAAGFLLAQVSVQDLSTGATRSCGSLFGTTVDRTGWETWWAADLDDPDVSHRTSLLRSTECPDALNSRLAVVGSLAAASVAACLLTCKRTGRVASRRPSDPGPRLARLGRLSFAAGTVLTALGLGGLVLLIADRDATLFIYVDRRVVAIAGLVILMPPTALLLLGRGLSIVSEHLEEDS